MNKRLVFLLSFAFVTLTSTAQVNFDGIHYQAVVRDTNGDPIPDQAIGVQVTLSNSLAAPYIETHNITTDAHGLLNLVIGEGTPGLALPSIADVDWTEAEWSYSISMDITGGTDYSLVSSGPFKAVPYAMHALTSGSVMGGGGHWNTSGSDIFNSNPGNVGIGTANPAAKLHVVGSTLVKDNVAGELNLIVENTNAPGTRTFVSSESSRSNIQTDRDLAFTTNSFNWSEKMRLTNAGNLGVGTSSPRGALDVDKHDDVWFGTYPDINFVFHNDELNVKSDGGAGQSMYIQYNTDGHTILNRYGNGNVGIGTSTPQSKLAVNGKITAKEVEVTLANFPDYVFDSDYDLMTLEEVDAYIKTHGHLPKVPSACEVEENGLGLGEMNRDLLEKVEELTLHLIAKEAELKQLRVEVDTLLGR